MKNAFELTQARPVRHECVTTSTARQSMSRIWGVCSREAEIESNKAESCQEVYSDVNIYLI